MCDSENFCAKWGEWFEKGWFDQLGKLGAAPENGDAYLGATGREVIYWIGMLFPSGTPAPAGFEYADIPAARYAVFELAGKEAGELFGEDGIDLVFEEMRERRMTPREDGWGIERYARPRSVDPGVKGNVLFEFIIGIK